MYLIPEDIVTYKFIIKIEHTVRTRDIVLYEKKNEEEPHEY